MAILKIHALSNALNVIYQVKELKMISIATAVIEHYLLIHLVGVRIRFVHVVVNERQPIHAITA